MLLYLVRHGQTEQTIQNVVQGQNDTPLNPTGQLQSLHLAHHLSMVPFTEAWSSDLVRAEETAKTILQFHPKIQLKTDERLRDRAFGDLEGKVWTGKKDIPNNAESLDHLGERLYDWLNNLIKIHTPLSSPSGTPRRQLSISPLSPVTPVSPISQSQPPPKTGSGIVLAVTHQECLLSILKLLSPDSPPPTPLREYPAQSGEGAGQKTVIDLHVPHGVDTSVECGETAVAIVRIWWEEDGEVEGKLVCRGRLEAWGVDEHLHQV